MTPYQLQDDITGRPAGGIGRAPGARRHRQRCRQRTSLSRPSTSSHRRRGVGHFMQWGHVANQFKECRRTVQQRTICRQYTDRTNLTTARAAAGPTRRCTAPAPSAASRPSSAWPGSGPCRPPGTRTPAPCGPPRSARLLDGERRIGGPRAGASLHTQVHASSPALASLGMSFVVEFLLDELASR